MSAPIQPGTPLPWSLGYGGCDIDGPNGQTVVIGQRHYGMVDRAYIVHACNAYPAMAERIAVLEAALSKIATTDSDGLAEYTPQAMVATARAALAKSTPDLTTRFEIEATRPEDDL